MKKHMKPETKQTVCNAAVTALITVAINTVCELVSFGVTTIIQKRAEKKMKTLEDKGGESEPNE